VYIYNEIQNQYFSYNKLATKNAVNVNYTRCVGVSDICTCSIRNNYCTYVL